MMGSLQKQPSGRWRIVNENDYVELTSGDSVEVFVTEEESWIPVRVEHQFQVGYVFWPRSGASYLLPKERMVAATRRRG